MLITFVWHFGLSTCFIKNPLVEILQSKLTLGKFLTQWIKIFLLKVMHKFGFSNLFFSRIKSILFSSKLYIYINGSRDDYFDCKKGVRQGYLLSPLLFCLVENVLNRVIKKIVEQVNLYIINGPKGSLVPSRVLYANYIMLFFQIYNLKH